ncbi:MAG TPA: hypothetical protein VD793_01230 [Gemmatimonadales bacterium]|nr:hypothetical protein [Gemmatimonadales bacterium]
MPTQQPALITIVREDVKIGRGAEHARFEAGWPAAYEKAKSPDYYLAFASMTGPNEVWYVSSYASHTAMGDGMKRDAADPVLTAELERLSRGDAEFLNNVRVMHAMGRRDLSMGTFPDLSKARFTEVTWFRVRPGREGDFEAAAKAYRSAAQRSSPTTSYRIYEIVAGVPGPTYLVFATVGSFGEFDQMAAAGQATMRGANPEEMAALQKFSTEALINSETQRFRVDPGQSYVAAETRAADPAFWMPKQRAGQP